ncbi:MAG: type II toxin-antitoxin system VapC family toxin [Rhodoglobus sp.]
MILLDTSILIAPPVDLSTTGMGASVISLGELEFGVAVAASVSERNFRLHRIARYSEVLEWIAFEEADARSYGVLAARVAPVRAGHARSKDILIAAQALTLGIPLMTRNEQDFELVSDLVEIVGPDGLPSPR